MQVNTETKYRCESKYASVRLLDSPYHLDKTYDYRIPDSCRDFIKTGSFVVLPYGNGNRRVVGVVCGFSDSVDYSEARIKPIDKIASERLSVSAEMLSLAEFIKKRCISTFGDALKLMLPPGSLQNLRESFTVTEKGKEEDISKLPPELFPLLGFIREKNTVSKDDIAISFPRGYGDVIDRLIEEGLIVRTIDISEIKDAYKTLVSIPEEKRGEELLHLVRGEKQKAVLSYLFEKGECEVSVCLSECGASRETIRSLEEKGLAVCKKELIRRDLGFLSDIKKREKREIKLSAAQKKAFDTLASLYEEDKPAAALLHGVTGSGKTSVMLKMIDKSVAEGKGVIVLLPEIALTPQTFSIFASRYERIALIHSGLSQGERRDAYMRIKSGEVDVCIGTRSAVFAPMPNLGLIIIDEEHEHTYKSDMSPRYHARDIAKFRCVYNNALLILASATPDIESYHNALSGRYTLVEMSERYGNATLPDVMVVDVKNNNSSSISPISPQLAKEIDKTLSRHEQAIIFINRRGFNNFFVCSACGEVVRCPSCDVSLTYHTARNDYGKGELRCHICGGRYSADIKCKNCGSDKFIRFGYGTQRVEKEISDIFPASTVIRMDTDTVDGDKHSYFEKLGAFKRREADILLGTSMITKGHDFPDVTLVGVLLADAALRIDDYRANERTYSMITQVIGRAGRADKKGLAVIQAIHPESEVIGLACEQNYRKFYEKEIELRRVQNFPPFCDMVLIEFVSERENILLDYAKSVGMRLRELKENEFSDIPLVIYGPFEAPVYRAEGKYRIRIIMKCRLNERSRQLLSAVMEEHSRNSFPAKPVMTINIGPTSI